jgi:hypothetical protein
MRTESFEWRYRLSYGKGIESKTQVTVNFRLR